MHSIRYSKHVMPMLAGAFFAAIWLVAATLSSPVAMAVPSSTTQAMMNSNSSSATRAELAAALAWRYKMDRELAPIQSRKELTAYLHLTAHSGSPLDAFPPRARARFLSSLVFTSAGLASYQYVDLQYLAPAQIYSILALFGAQRDTPMIAGAQSVNAESTQSETAARPRLLDTSGVEASGLLPHSDHKDYSCYGGNCLANTGGICNPAVCAKKIIN